MENQELKPSSQSIYCYPGTTVLINNKDIKDKAKLLKLEKMLVVAKLSTLINGEQPFRRDLSINHYIALHKYLFGDLYPFGGELRREFTNKKNDEIEGEEGTRIYCSPPLIYQKLDEQLKKMKSQATKIYTRESFVNFLANSYMELYYIHPFREGNSRTLREFLREYVELMDKLLIKFGNYKLDYSSLQESGYDNFIRAVIWNTSNDKNKQEKSIELLKEVFDQCLIEYEIENKKSFY